MNIGLKNFDVQYTASKRACEANSAVENSSFIFTCNV